MMIEKIEKICIVYGTKEAIDQLIAAESWGGGMLGGSKKINLIEIDPKTEHFKELRHGLIKGFEE